MQEQQDYNNFSDIKIIDQDALPELNDALDSALVSYVNDIVSKSDQARRDCNGVDLVELYKKIDKAFNLQHQDAIKKKPKYRSKVYLPWIKEAIISVVAYFAAMLLSGNWYSLLGNTPEDKKNAEKMTKVINYLFQSNYEFRKVIIQVLLQFTKRGMTCCKGFWQLIETYMYDYEETQDPATGEPAFIRKKNKKTLYNDVKLEYRDIENFHFYPVNKPLSEVTQVDITSIKYSDLIANYNNRWIPEQLAKITDNKSTGSTDETPIELREAWISECYIDYGEGKKKINNIIVTIADNHIIEYKPNPYDYGVRPFMWSVFEPIEGTNLGKGVCHDAHDIQQSANLLFNALLDDVKTKVYGMWKAKKGTNIEMLQNRPGGVILVDENDFQQGSDPRPVEQPTTHNSLTLDTIMSLKKEFESASVPEFIKGSRPEKDETATRDVLVQQGSENKLTVAADNFNEEILKPLLILIYTLYRQRSQIDQETRLKIAKLCVDHTKEVELITGGTTQIEKTPEEILAEFGEILPLDRVDVAIDGYKTNIKKREFIQNMQIVIQELGNADEYIQGKFDQESALKKMLLALDIDADELIFTDSEALKYQIKKMETLMSLESTKMIMQAQEQAKLLNMGIMPNVAQPTDTKNTEKVSAQG